MDKIKLDTGYISGMVKGEPGKEVRVFRGIPYAAPPVDELRWRPPQPVEPWGDVLECTMFSKITPQSEPHIPGTDPDKPDQRLLSQLPQSEDCLYLNVLTPAKKASDKLPVMVWIHGGGFIFGSGNEPISNLIRLPQHGVVQVNVNMRLGPLGMLVHRLLSKESQQGVSGNYMLLDMIAALQWVQRNIAAFGGDPGNVTIFGESGGAGKVVGLLASPLTKGLFHRAIVESGSTDAEPMAKLEVMGDKFFGRLGVDKEKDALKAARALPWEKIMAVEKELVEELGAFGHSEIWDINVDGWVLTEKPSETFKSGKQNPVPFILHANLGELSTPPGAYLIPSYLLLLSGAAKAGVNAHAIIFDHVPSRWKQEGCFCNHAMELGYVFGDWDNSTDFWQHIMPLAEAAGAKSPDPGLTDIDRKLSELMMRIWTQYAKTGDPNVPDIPKWPVYDKATEQYLFITPTPEIKRNYSNLPNNIE